MGTARLFELLSLLQRPRSWSATELAGRLEASPRTIRRDVERLRELGYLVEATMGATGGYRLAAGGSMPPLVLDDDEAVAIVLGLRTAAAQAVAGIDEASIRALAKVLQVLPSRLRQRVGALATLDGAATASLAAPDQPRQVVDPDDLTRLAAAVEGHQRVGFDYEAADGARSERRVEPYGVVTAGRRWYLVAFDVDRDDWRTFRVDRVEETRATAGRFEPRPMPEDPAAFVLGSIERMSRAHEVVVDVAAAADDVERRIGRWATIEPTGSGTCRVRMTADELEWPVLALTQLDADFTVLEPPELRARVADAGRRFSRAALNPAVPASQTAR
jgi:predicted DNA-binding transcriptional regulator YafY